MPSDQKGIRADNNVPIKKNEYSTKSSAELGRERIVATRSADVNLWFAFSIGCFGAQAQSATTDGDDAKSRELEPQDHERSVFWNIGSHPCKVSSFSQHPCIVVFRIVIGYKNGT